MGSGDLNLLKSWNPKLVKNRKKVWETEQELLKEEQKLEERRKEIEKERELNELINSDVNHGKSQKQTGLEWMYKSVTFDENEDYLLGKKKLDTTIIKNKPIDDKPKKDTTIAAERPKYDYSNDDPMSKFNKVQKRSRPVEKKKVSKPSVTRKNTNTATTVTKNYKDFDY
ncbi:hypothetical protein KAFR_0D03720 [Kazachstania africana CBS 2517]|uniref:Pre-mRNA-splicing factor CWC25 n=1 Tax=Kazachstania africana (strain ATCC 22294 / BCRC 22015 / CBS 2517 / CECT 1963 / NBRC 1671 / NRRL Y-8276) TaxID=1071382 RepID=H2AUH0_KAZAF|nr:hypothetical protein KAFR_0D03720 [Kazachstania africana CBS 2517]CCF58020.1 hypothetical protein KAFR_0D03720 [Kazachstania africana CBS 2517]